MKKIKVKKNSALFVLFLGIALLEAFQKHNWFEAILFVFLAFYFLTIDKEQ